MIEPPGLDEAALYCPACGSHMRRLVQHRDYFCDGCHVVVELLDGAFALVQADLVETESLVTLETLRARPSRVPRAGPSAEG